MKSTFTKMPSIQMPSLSTSSPSSTSDDSSQKEKKGFTLKFESMGRNLKKSMGGGVHSESTNEDESSVNTTRNRMGSLSNPMSSIGNPIASLGNPMASMGNPISSMGNSMASMGNSMSLMGMGSSNRKSKAIIESDVDTKARISKVMAILEDCRLQCPQTHIGLVVAFASSNLTPITCPDLKFKWHRIDPGNGQFHQIDESTRAWYPPTVDDIGRKICLQCEDTLDQGYCRYIEAGPVEADPLLVTLMVAAIDHGRYELRDVSTSMGISSNTSIGEAGDVEVGDAEHISSPTTVTSEVSGTLTSTPITSSEFDLHAIHRPSALTLPLHSVSPLLELSARMKIEVSVSGLRIVEISPEHGTGTGSDTVTTAASMTSNSKSPPEIFISQSPATAHMKVTCALPASVVIHLPLHVSKSHEANKGEEGGVGDTVLPSLPWEWRGGESHSGEMYEQFSTAADSVTATSQELRICFACGDRLQRDALALSLRCLLALPVNAEPRQRLQILPWLSGEGGISRAASGGGQDICSRLKVVEDENALLRRQKNELTLQLLEQSSNNTSIDGSSSTSSLTVASASASASGDPGNALDSSSGGNDSSSSVMPKSHTTTAATTLKIRELEAVVAASKSKEMECEHLNLELSSRNRKQLIEMETQTKIISELRQKISSLQEEIVEWKAKNVNDVEQITHLKEELRRSDREKGQVLHASNVEQEKTINELRSALASAESEVRSIQESKSKLEEANRTNREEVCHIASALDKAQDRIAELVLQNDMLSKQRDQLQSDILLLQEEKKTAEEGSISPQKVIEMQNKADALTGERNHWQKKAESLSKDLRRVMHEAADRERELEKQVDNKRTEVETMRRELEVLRQRESEEIALREAAEANKKGKRLGSLNLGGLSLQRKNDNHNNNNNNGGGVGSSGGGGGGKSDNS